MDALLTWMASSTLAALIVENAWVFPTLEILHFFGLVLLIGSLYVIDLCVLGLAPGMKLESVMQFVPVSVAGFVINLITGILFLFVDPYHYYTSVAFRLKMLTVALAIVNAVGFNILLKSGDSGAGDLSEPDTLAKWLAGLSLFFWTSVVVLGRMIPYMTSEY